MHLTLHLTNQCNLACKYCFVPRGPERMSREVAFAAARFAVGNSPANAPKGLLFYGGEPLLERQLIYDLVDYTQAIKKRDEHEFIYKITTNGVLLNEEFLKFAEKVNLMVGFSHDGAAQDDCRLFPNGSGSFEMLNDTIPLLLKYQPYAVGMSVVDPTTSHRASEIVKWLYDAGFRYITMGVNYGGDAGWTNETLNNLACEYKKMGEMYVKWTKNEQKFYLSTFDMKILSHLKGEKYNIDRRKMSANQLSVAPNGKLYTASRFVSDEKMAIGDVFTGIDEEKRKFLDEKGATPPLPCQQCALRTRCNYAYDTLKRDGDDVVSDISPIQCAHEQIITPIADRVAEKLYKDRNALFLHKHYNELYPVMSLVEDRAR